MVSKKVLLLSALILAVGSGCTKTVEPTVLPELPERESENMVGDLSITTAEIDKEFTLNAYASCDVHIAYPQFTAGALPDIVALQTDHAIAHFVAGGLEYRGDVETTAELDAIATKYLSDCQEEIETEYRDLQNEDPMLFTNLKRSLDIVYNVKLNEGGRVSFGLDGYAYTGGAHPNQWMEYITFDTTLDRPVKLSDIIAPEHLQHFMQHEAAALLADNRENLYPEYADSFDAIIEAAEMTPETQMTEFGDFNKFYLTPTSIVTYYNAYDIAPYAAGPIFVEIPFTDIADFVITPNTATSP